MGGRRWSFSSTLALALLPVVRRTAAPWRSTDEVRAEVVGGTPSERAFWRSATWFCVTCILCLVSSLALVLSDLPGLGVLRDPSEYTILLAPAAVLASMLHGALFAWHTRREARLTKER